jgi:hypothetical protein
MPVAKPIIKKSPVKQVPIKWPHPAPSGPKLRPTNTPKTK